MRQAIAIALLLLTVGCGSVQTQLPSRIVLLAPFEGQYREVGYQALYAARFAIAESGRTDVDLLAVDDGGSPATARDRAKALSYDPQIEAVLVLGPHASDVAVIDLLSPRTVIIGSWSTNIDLLDIGTSADSQPCGDVCLLPAYLALADDPTVVTIETTSPPVDDAFREAYLATDPFAPEPLPIAQHTYDRMQIILFANDRALPAVDAIWRYRYREDGTLIASSPGE